MPTQLPGDCSGQVAASVAIAYNIDAIREQLICLNQLLPQALPTREYLALRDKLFIQAIADVGAMICRSLAQLGNQIARTDAPALSPVELDNVVTSDLGTFNACTSQLYCPPGYIRNEMGVCVPDA